jgi:predicted transposase YbfD/YdcC
MRPRGALPRAHCLGSRSSPTSLSRCTGSSCLRTTRTTLARYHRRRNVLEADIVTRSTPLASHGWASALNSLSCHTSRLGDGRLQVNGHELPDRDRPQAQHLDFVPVHSDIGWDMSEHPDRYALIYPVSCGDHTPSSRRHGGIDNKIHWVCDVVFAEEGQHAYLGSSAQVMACARNLAIGLLCLAGHQKIKASPEHVAGRRLRILPLLAASRS